MAKRLSSLVVLISLLSLAAACGDTSTPAPANSAVTTSGANTTIAVGATTAAAAVRTGEIVNAAARPAIPESAKKGGTLTFFSTSALPVDLHPAPAIPAANFNWTNIISFVQGPLLVTFNDTTLKWEY